MKRNLMTHTLEPHDFKYLTDSVKFCTMGDAECAFIDVKVDADIEPADRSVGALSASVSICCIEVPDGRLVQDLLTTRCKARIEDAYLEWTAQQGRDAKDAYWSAKEDEDRDRRMERRLEKERA